MIHNQTNKLYNYGIRAVSGKHTSNKMVVYIRCYCYPTPVCRLVGGQIGTSLDIIIPITSQNKKYYIEKNSHRNFKGYGILSDNVYRYFFDAPDDSRLCRIQFTIRIP